ncbi:hypothetical protein [Antarcticimicrobium sediminis]|uniref:Uncharacterized protein n=1 Tax=Antarcticimicrobium sediminis TaxID=2546227 RepID=A0A4R5EH83_9RHOB|nr:hypothetical protein [Antarcticimicrobium sediminis]TDE33718.1 hypothetical protein E1B25_21000 [Antarcticimicrobium sediminis]
MNEPVTIIPALAPGRSTARPGPLRTPQDTAGITMNGFFQPPHQRRSDRCIFTICTRSYIGLAEALRLSMRNNGVVSDFLIVAVDHAPVDVSAQSGTIVSAQEFCGYSDAEWASRTFKYDLVELCTSIKARVFRSAFALGYEKAIYFDPDIIVFDDLGGVFGALDIHDAVATPHRLGTESSLSARGGVFNLGFLAARRGAAIEKVMTWWDERLDHYSINDPLRGYFTDQKWMDHLPVLLRNDQLLVSDHPGMNLAPWNLAERELRGKDGRWEVRLREDGAVWQKLCFVHFSAFDYRGLAAGKTIAAAGPAEEKMPGFGALLDVLAHGLKRGGFLEHAAIPYQFATYSDGTLVLAGHRRIYHRLIEAGRDLPAPFETGGGFHARLKRAGLLAAAGGKPSGRPDAKTRTAQIGRAAKALDILARIVVRLFGYNRFELLSKLLVRYFHPVNHARLLRDRDGSVDVEYF